MLLKLVSGVLRVQEGLLDLCFFKETVNCGRFVQVVVGQLFPELREEERICDWFQQDSVTAHTEHMSMQTLFSAFEDRNINSGIWPARSHDLNPCDFLFWGYLKDKVYISKRKN
jgi:hypothetical protein